MPRYLYAAEAVIDAPVEAVWAVLTDLARYDAWNPFTPVAKSTLRPGEPIDMRVHMDAYRVTISQRETVRAVEPNAKIVWGAEMMLGLVRAERTQTLEALGPTRTRYRTEDVIEGALSPLVHALMGGSVQRGFEGVARGLREACERARRAP
ncbi:MAG: SRPBCC domain-containing protein [Sandaracinaceae bacterium]|nr:SRPBCC domain-containing protein [Sandaracinaceae bacterium]